LWQEGLITSETAWIHKILIRLLKE